MFTLKSLQSGNTKKLKNCLIHKTKLLVISMILVIVVFATSVVSMPKMLFEYIIC